MKKHFLYLALPGVAVLFTACHKNNYVTNIPAPSFTYVHAEAKNAPEREQLTLNEQLPIPSEQNRSENVPLVLAANDPLFPVAENSINLTTTAASKAAKVKLMKELSTAQAASGKKFVLKQRLLQKMLVKHIEKKQNSAKPKARKTNTVSLLSGIAGIVGLVLLFTSAGAIALVLAAAAIIMGFVGKAQIRRNDEAGVGWAITGIVSGILIFFLLLLAVLFIASLLGL
jgi:hypothetical protein